MRLIDADALIAEYDRVHVGPPGGARKLMEEAPTVEAVEVKHGRWLWDAENETWLCDSCGSSALNNYRSNPVDSNYCPNCGAKMHKENADGNS